MRGTPRSSLLVATVVGLGLELMYLLGSVFVVTRLAGMSRALDGVEAGDAGGLALLQVGAAVAALLIVAALVSLAAAARGKALPRVLAPRPLLLLVGLVNAPVALLALLRGDWLTGVLLGAVLVLVLLAASPRRPGRGGAAPSVPARAGAGP
jgi:mannose/fructose/N-acetylgalactosamine-specific phosphotransferase system component IIC